MNHGRSIHATYTCSVSNGILVKTIYFGTLYLKMMQICNHWCLNQLLINQNLHWNNMWCISTSSSYAERNLYKTLISKINCPKFVLKLKVKSLSLLQHIPDVVEVSYTIFGTPLNMVSKSFHIAIWSRKWNEQRNWDKKRRLRKGQDQDGLGWLHHN